MHTRASNSELVEPLPKPERTLNRRLRRRNRKVPYDQRNNPPQHPRIIYPSILDINYFRRFLDILRNYDPMDDEPMWAVDRVVALTLDSAITIPETANKFAIKGNHLTLIKGNQFDGRTKIDPHKHIYEFLGICDMFKYRDTKNEVVRLMMFPLSLTDEAKTWLDELNEGTIETWDELRTAFISRFFLLALFDRILKEICAFSQHENESLTDAWLLTQEVLNAAADGIFLYKTPNQAYQLLEDKVLLKLDWAKNQKTKSFLKKTVALADEELQSHAKQLTPNLDDDDMPMSREKEAKFMQTFRKTRFYNDYRDRDSNRDNWRSSTRNDYNRDNYRSNTDDKPYDLQKQFNDFMKSQQSTNAFVKETFMDLKTQFETVAKNHQASIQNLENKFDKLADKQSGRPSRSLPSNTQPNPQGSKAYQPPQARNEHVNAVFTRSAIQINVPLVDVLARMPNYGKFLKELISNKHKIKQISAAFLSNESSAMIQNKVPPKLGDLGSFLIPCNFNKTFSCKALANLGARINLMPYSLYAKLSLETLTPTKMSVRLADRSFQYPVEIAKNMLVEVGKFTFPADFVILEMEEDSKVPLILGRPFLHIADAVIRVKQKQINLGVRTERMILNIDSSMKHSYSNDDTFFSIDVIDEILEEDFDALLDEGSKILHSFEGTLLEEEIFSEFDEFMAMTADENSESESDTEEPPFEKITINTDYKIKTSLEYVFLEEIVKLLDTGIIYPIADSPWVSPIHCIPKKGGITVVTNENDELVPTRTVTG
ncbi:reverse transcriptase domain-containing protein [Tanacetum coccineum]